MTVYRVGKDRIVAKDSRDAVVLASKMLEGAGTKVRVNIYADRALYGWVQIKIGVGDNLPHPIYYKSKWKFGKPLTSEYKVIVNGTRWTKDKNLDGITWL